MAISSALLYLSLSLLFLTAPASGAGNGTLSAYDVLRSYDFPPGLLPEGVTGYDLDRSSGDFTARLNGSCSFTISGYSLKYQSTITGRISKDKLSNLKGVSVKVLFFWINIVEVSRSDEELRFSVGIASADFPVDSFVESPRCGCGFDCVSGEAKSDNSGFVEDS